MTATHSHLLGVRQQAAYDDNMTSRHMHEVTTDMHAAGIDCCDSHPVLHVDHTSAVRAAARAATRAATA